MTSSTDWQLALDLLIARASLDSELASSLRDQPLECCADNGVIIPENINLVIADTDEEVIVKTIPGIQEVNQTFNPINKQVVGSKTYNSGETEAEAEAEVAQTNESTVEVEVSGQCVPEVVEVVAVNTAEVATAIVIT